MVKLSALHCGTGYGSSLSKIELVLLIWICQFSGLFSSVRIHFKTQGHCVHPGTEAKLMSVGQVGPLFWPFMFFDMLTCSTLHSDTCLPKRIKAILDYLITSVLSTSLCGILTGQKIKHTGYVKDLRSLTLACLTDMKATNHSLLLFAFTCRLGAVLSEIDYNACVSLSIRRSSLLYGLYCALQGGIYLQKCTGISLSVSQSIKTQLNCLFQRLMTVYSFRFNLTGRSDMVWLCEAAVYCHWNDLITLLLQKVSS